MRSTAVDSGVTWMEQSKGLQRAAAHCEIAAVEKPSGVDYVPTGIIVL